MSMKEIRATYGVPAKRGARVEYFASTPGKPLWSGTILSEQGGYLRIRCDGDESLHPHSFHPVLGLRYLSGNE